MDCSTMGFFRSDDTPMVNLMRHIKLDSRKFVLLTSFFMLVPGVALADGPTLGTMASLITDSFGSITKLITGGSYIAGLGFAMGAVMKFKQHKDNPTQIPVGTPIALLFISASLLYFPSILSTTGYTLFSDGGTVAGPTGIIFGLD